MLTTGNGIGGIHVPIQTGMGGQEAQGFLFEPTRTHLGPSETHSAVVLGGSPETLYNKLNGYTREAAFSHN